VLQAEPGTREVVPEERRFGKEGAEQVMSRAGLHLRKGIRSNLTVPVEQLLGSQKETGWT